MASPISGTLDSAGSEEALVVVLRETLVILKTALESLLEDTDAADYGLDGPRTS